MSLVIFLFSVVLSAFLEDVHLKLLIPCVAAGAIIGKGGEAVEKIKRQTGARLKMSKANDFYPGNNIFPIILSCLSLSDFFVFFCNPIFLFIFLSTRDPGTVERVCVIVGSVRACMQLTDYIMRKISERPEISPCNVPFAYGERHNQVRP